MSTPTAAPTTASLVATLHDTYRLHSGLQVPVRAEWERRWVHYLAQGYTVEDLGILLRYLKREIRHERRNQGSLLLRNLLEWGPDNAFLRLDEDMALAKAALAPPTAAPVVKRPAAPPAPVANQAQLSDWARRARELAQRVRVTATVTSHDVQDAKLSHGGSTHESA